MLFESTVEPRTLQLLRDLQGLDELKEFILVGGTSLALQIGHRISIDLDLFCSDEIEIATIPELLQSFGKIEIMNQTKSILNLFIDDIKVDFVSYRYKLIKDFLEIDDFRLASIEDISAMKLAAVTGRGSKKDFIDLYFILKQFSLSEIFEFYNRKYPDSSDFLVYKSLMYFDDAELEPMPKMLIPTDWNLIKEEIIDQVRLHFP